MKHLIGIFVIAFILQIIFAAPSSTKNAMVDSSNALNHLQSDAIIDTSAVDAVVRLPRGAKHRQNGVKRRKNKKGRKGKKQRQNGGGKKARKNGGQNSNNNNN